MVARGTRGGKAGGSRYRWLGLGVLALTLGGGPGCSKEAAFRDAMYPKDPRLPPPLAYDLTAAASLTPLVASGFDAPVAAAACLREVLSVPELADRMDLVPAFRDRMADLMAYANCVDPITDRYHGDESPAGRRRRCAVAHLGTELVPPAAPEPEPGGVTDGVRAGAGAFGLRCGNAGALGHLDRLRAIRVVTDLAETISVNERAATGQTLDPEKCWAGPVSACGCEDVRDRYERGVQRSIALGLALLEADPAATRPAGAPPITSFPTLALSGGAANGAFTAGYFHALLGLRLAALSGMAHGAGKKLDAEYRFSTVAGTSVGSLVGLLIDLYFAPERPQEPRLPELPAALFPGCSHQGPPDPTWHERCALGALEAIFNHTDEGDLLCAERGSVVGLVASGHGDDHLLRFDPLLDEILTPFVARFHRVLLDNDLVRLTVGADLTQNVAIGLDERACRLPGIDPEQCILRALQTSISEPVFVPPVRKVYSGLYLEAGEGSAPDATARLTWFDGGLRSGTPADLALLRAGGARSNKDPSFARVLTVTTTPFEGITKTHPKNGLSTFFDSTFDAVDQVRKWEIAHAQLLAEARRTSLWTFGGRPAAAGTAATPTTAAPPPAPAALGSADVEAPSLAAEATGASRPPRPSSARTAQIAAAHVNASVLPIFVPSTIEPRALFAAGYQFDPMMMRGLYLWGVLTFLKSHDRVLSFLRWEELLDWEDLPIWLARERWAAEDALCRGFGAGDDCRVEDVLATDEQLAEHFQRRRREVRKSVKKCPRD